MSTEIFTLKGTISVDDSGATKVLDQTAKKAKQTSDEIDKSAQKGSSSFASNWADKLGLSGAAVTRFKDKFAEVGNATSGVSGFLSKTADGAFSLGNKFSLAGDAIQLAGKKTLEFGTSGITGKLAMGGLAAGAGLIASGVNTAIGRMDTMRSATLTMTKGLNMSEKEAKAFVGGIRDMASGTQYTTTSLSKMAAGYMAAGLDANRTTATIQTLTDTVAGLGGGQAEIDSFSTQLQQTASVGKVTTQDLNIMGASVTGLRAEMTKKFYNGDGAMFQKDLEAGNITAEMVSDTVQDMGTKYKGAAKESLGFAGTFEVMKQRIGAGMQGIIEEVGGGEGAPKIMKLMKDVADGISQAFKDVTPKIVDFVNKAKKIWEDNKELITFIAKAVGALVAMKMVMIVLAPLFGPLAFIFKTLGVAIKGVGIAINIVKVAWALLNAAWAMSPLGVIIIAIVALVAALVWFFTQTKIGQKIWASFMSFLNDAWQAILATFYMTLDYLSAFFSGVWNSIKDVTMAVWNGIKTFFTVFFAVLGAIFTTAINLITMPFILAFNILKGIVELVWNAIGGVIMTVVNLIWMAIQLYIGFVIAYWTTIFNIIWFVASTIFTAVWTTISTIINWIWTGIQMYLTFIINLWTAVFNAIILVATTIFNAVWGFISGVISTIYNGIKAFLDRVIQVWRSIFNSIRDFVSPIFNAISNTISNVMNAIVNTISNIINTIKNVFTSGFNAAKDIVSSVFNGIKDTISNVFNGAVDIVRSVIDKIKGFFSFSVKLPHIDLPHFSIKPDGWELGDLLKGKIPSLGIDWYANGGIMTAPTLMGMNGGNAMVGGEAGREAVLPLNASTLGAIGRGIAATMQNAGNEVNVTQNIYSHDALTPREIGIQTKNQLQRMLKTT